MPRSAARGTLGPVPDRVLLVGDHHDEVQLLALRLRSAKYIVETAPDARSALAAVPSYRPHYVVLEIGLPDLDGYELARRLRTTPGAEGTWIVALTGYASAEHRARSQGAGINAHLVKPVGVRAVIDAFSRLG